MNNKRKWILLTACILLFAFVSARIVYVNRGRSELMPRTEYYPFGETVEIGEAFLGNGSKIQKGYTAKVLDTQIYTAAEAKEKFPELDDNGDAQTAGYCIVKVQFANVDNQQVGEQGIDPSIISLTCVNTMILNEDAKLYSYLNPSFPQQGEGMIQGFSLRPGTSMDVFIPYVIFQNSLTSSYFQKDLDVLRNKDFYLKLTDYPERKMIAIRPE